MYTKDKSVLKDTFNQSLNKPFHKDRDVPADDYSAFEVEIQVFLDSVFGWSDGRGIINENYIRKVASDFTGCFTPSSVKLFTVIVADYLRRIHIPKVQKILWGKCINAPYKVENGMLYADVETMMQSAGLGKSFAHTLYLIRLLNEEAKALGTPQLNFPDVPKGKVSQLSLDLLDNQIEVLYHKLIEHKFIHKDTDEASFKWMFGGETMPIQILPIQWTARSKQSFREMIEGFVNPITNQMIRDIEQLFVYKNKPFRLGKADKNHSSNIQDIESIVESVKTAQ